MTKVTCLRCNGKGGWEEIINERTQWRDCPECGGDGEVDAMEEDPDD